MNIGSMINQNYMINRLTASTRKGEVGDDIDYMRKRLAASKLKGKVEDDIDTVGGKNTFDGKLRAFRQDNAFAKLKVTSKEVEPDKTMEHDRLKVLCSEQLFSIWDDNLSPEAALAKLDENLSRIGKYTIDSPLDVEEVLEHIATQYTLYKRHIAKFGSSEQSAKLDELVGKHTTQYAKDFSEVVGGFYEENGMSGERERIYTAVMDSVNDWTKATEKFIANPKNKFELWAGTVQNDGKSLSNELRMAVKDHGLHEGNPGDGPYGSSDLSTAAKMMKFSEEQLCLGEEEISNEEELGVHLGKATLQALSFMRNFGGVEKNFRGEAFLLSVRKKSEQYLDKVDVLLADKAAQYREDNPDKWDTPFSPIDRDAVFAVVDTMSARYKQTASVSESLEVGKSYGLRQYLSKVNSESETERYRGSSFWQGVIKTTLDPKSKPEQKYSWVQRMLDDRTNSWLNVVA